MNTVELEQRITDAAADFERVRGTLEAARRHREHVTEERVRTIGRIAAGDPVAIPDLDRLATEYVGASHALQDAQLVTAAAGKALADLQKRKPGVMNRESAEHLRALLALRAQLSTAVDHALDQLVAAAELYVAVVNEANGTSAQLGAHPNWTKPMGPPVGRRVIARCRSIAVQEFPSSTGGPVPAVAQVDAEVVTFLERFVERYGGPAAESA